MKRATLAALIGSSALGLGLSLAAPEAKALCLPSDPGPCTTFNPSTASKVIKKLSPNSLASVSWLQAGVTSTVGGQTISQIAFSKVDPVNNFNAGSFQVLDASLNTLTSPALQPGTQLNLGSALGVSDIWLRYQIDSPNTLTPGDVVQVSLIGNDNGFSELGFLSNSGENFYFAETVQNNAVRDVVPGPLPLLGAGAAFGFSRKLRRRIKATA